MDSNKNHPTPTMGNTDTPKDGELTLPSDYKTWPKFLVDIDKEPIKQVRDIYINGVGSRTMPGQSFSNGTVMIMEIHKAKLQADGSVEKTPEGRLIKDGLAKVFIMGKGEGWGQAVPDNFKNGAWIYGAAGSDGKPISEDFTKCRACHAPLAQKDFVHRYDEYFEKRGGI
jgi:hemoglobin